ncbi:DUF6703 family protein [Lapillicoccus sp.]|uniref:DUF6703 family protein n=1 Tax=Lapillicoccus sp. TaxID=1909287 RepID=UPI003983B459
MSLPFRSRLEHRTYRVMERMNALPRIVPFVVIFLLIVVGILVPHVGFVATGIVAAFVGFLVYSTWPRLSMPEKLMRLAVLFIAVALTAVQALPRS